ncbi:MAG: mandelate racemase/muconate lactonizing protein, partial [Chloroflexi bacterium]|nr:mandelate racemase/muconate lactonizing protein [Chloroflexota bacterium]
SPAVCPMLEYLVLANEMKQWFHTTTYKPENGLVRLPTDPGLGVALDESKIVSQQELNWE